MGSRGAERLRRPDEGARANRYACCTSSRSTPAAPATTSRRRSPTPSRTPAAPRSSTCVLNTIDDALDRSDPGGTEWTADTVKHLLPLLERARRARRVVVLTSDHGHVIERREARMEPADAISSNRSRPFTGGRPPGDGEVRVTGTPRAQARRRRDPDLGRAAALRAAQGRLPRRRGARPRSSYPIHVLAQDPPRWLGPRPAAAPGLVGRARSARARSARALRRSPSRPTTPDEPDALRRGHTESTPTTPPSASTWPPRSPPPRCTPTSGHGRPRVPITDEQVSRPAAPAARRSRTPGRPGVCRGRPRRTASCGSVARCRWSSGCSTSSSTPSSAATRTAAPSCSTSTC